MSSSSSAITKSQYSDFVFYFKYRNNSKLQTLTGEIGCTYKTILNFKFLTLNKLSILLSKYLTTSFSKISTNPKIFTKQGII